MSKRKRVYFDDDEKDLPPKKKLKVVSGEESLNILKNKNNHVIKPNEKTKGFSPVVHRRTVDRQSDIVGVFGEDIPFMKKWKIEYPYKFNKETKPDALEKFASEVDFEFNQTSSTILMIGDRSEESFIELVVRKVCAMVSEEKGRRCVYGPQDEVVRHAGSVDFVISFETVIKVVIIVAKEEELVEGARQLIMELKALQEEQDMKDKWYYGFSALGRRWKPLRLNMNKNGQERVEVGGILIPYGKFQKESLKKLMYVLYKMILGEF